MVAVTAAITATAWAGVEFHISRLAICQGIRDPKSWQIEPGLVSMDTGGRRGGGTVIFNHRSHLHICLSFPSAISSRARISFNQKN